MSRPYPVGEKMAGHKLASLYIILAGADFIVCQAGKCGRKLRTMACTHHVDIAQLVHVFFRPKWQCRACLVSKRLKDQAATNQTA